MIVALIVIFAPDHAAFYNGKITGFDVEKLAT
jgi:hypothetical protein